MNCLPARCRSRLKDNGETSRNHVMLSHMETPVPDLLALRKENLPKDWPTT